MSQVRVLPGAPAAIRQPVAGNTSVMPTREFDAVVVGGGPAGLSAALWMGRYRCRTLVIDAGHPRNENVAVAHGYFSRDCASPQQLLADGRRDLERYPEVRLVEGEVTDLSGSIGAFSVRFGGEGVTAKRIVLATGVRDELPDIEGLPAHFGTSAFTCPSCDGYEAQGKRVVVIGWSREVAGFALTLDGWADHVTVVTDGHRFEGDDHQRQLLAAAGIDLREVGARGLVGSPPQLAGVELVGGEVLDAQMLFFTLGNRAASPLAESLGCRRTDEGCIEVDEHGLTSVPGVYAAGDMAPGPHLIQVAAAQGATAGIGCAQSLWEEGPAWKAGPPEG
jgi:thioredoxin reductase